MFEVPRAGENHRHAEFVAGGDHFRITFGSAGLNDGFDTSTRGDPGDIIERKEQIEEHTSELQSRQSISYAVFCFKKYFFNDTATTEIYTGINTLSLHDALPISE